MITSPRHPPQTKGKNSDAALSVLSEETMSQKYNEISSTYVNEYVKAGYPPKIIAQLVGSLCGTEVVKQQVLDIGCGKGEVGKVLR